MGKSGKEGRSKDFKMRRKATLKGQWASDKYKLKKEVQYGMGKRSRN